VRGRFNPTYAENERRKLEVVQDESVEMVMDVYNYMCHMGNNTESRAGRVLDMICNISEIDIIRLRKVFVMLRMELTTHAAPLSRKARHNSTEKAKKGENWQFSLARIRSNVQLYFQSQKERERGVDMFAPLSRPLSRWSCRSSHVAASRERTHSILQNLQKSSQALHDFQASQEALQVSQQLAELEAKP